jgi:hypothetical protein
VFKGTECQCEVHLHAVKVCSGIAACAGCIIPQGRDRQYTLNKSWVYWGGDTFPATAGKSHTHFVTGAQDTFSAMV